MDKAGNDYPADLLTAVADGLTAYGVRDNNEHVNIVDGVITGLQKYREEMVQLGKIKTLESSQ